MEHNMELTLLMSTHKSAYPPTNSSMSSSDGSDPPASSSPLPSGPHPPASPFPTPPVFFQLAFSFCFISLNSLILTFVASSSLFLSASICHWISMKSPSNSVSDSDGTDSRTTGALGAVKIGVGQGGIFKKQSFKCPP